jgi:hypothetical protein
LGLEYLPYHFLLASLHPRRLIYRDTTTGYSVAEHEIKGPYTVMRQNPSNAIVALGGARGTVEWWTPGVGKPAVSIFVGAGVDDIGFYKGYMYTAAESVKVWDTRMMKPLFTYQLDRKATSI